MDVYRKIVTKMDFSLLLVVGILIGAGLLTLSSSTTHLSGNYVLKQTLWIIFSMIVLLLMIRFDYAILEKYTAHLYIATLVLLVAVRIFGEERGGAVSWFVIPGLGSIQPAEFAKISIIICFAKYLSDHYGKLQTIADMLPAFALVALPVLLIMTQPDLGSALVFIAFMVGMMFAAGANWKILLLLFGGGTIAMVGYVVGIWKFGWWSPLETYQLNRFLVLFDSSIDPTGIGYNVWQAKIAIGNGGLLGQGIGAGSQSVGNFLPAQWTDFAYAVLSEELGFLGSGAILLLFFLLILRSVRAAAVSRDLFGSLIIIGITSMYLFHVFENIGMNLGIMPVTGIPLPFISYGGSSLLTNMIGIALIENIYIRKQRLIF